MITRQDYFKGRDKLFKDDYSPLIEQNATDTISRVNRLIEAYNASRKLLGLPPIKAVVTSGWRPPTVNAQAGGAKKSNHMLALACDISDPDGALDAWCMANLPVLEKLGLWLEHPDSTKSWTHVQTVPTASGRRVFRP